MLTVIHPRNPVCLFNLYISSLSCTTWPQRETLWINHFIHPEERSDGFRALFPQLQTAHKWFSARNGAAPNTAPAPYSPSAAARPPRAGALPGTAPAPQALTRPLLLHVPSSTQPGPALSCKAPGTSSRNPLASASPQALPRPRPRPRCYSGAGGPEFPAPRTRPAHRRAARCARPAARCRRAPRSSAAGSGSAPGPATPPSRPAAAPTAAAAAGNAGRRRCARGRGRSAPRPTRPALSCRAARPQEGGCRSAAEGRPRFGRRPL